MNAQHLRQMAINNISSDFRLHILFDPKPKGDGPAYEYRPHKKWLVLHSDDHRTVQEGVALALAVQLGAIYTGKGPVKGLEDLIRRVPGALAIYHGWERKLLYWVHSRGTPMEAAA